MITGRRGGTDVEAPTAVRGGGLGVPPGAASCGEKPGQTSTVSSVRARVRFGSTGMPGPMVVVMVALEM